MFIIIPILFALLSGMWFFYIAYTSGRGLVVCFIFLILGFPVFFFGQEMLWGAVGAIWPRFIWRMLTSYPDSYSIVGSFVLTEILLVLIGLLLRKIFLPRSDKGKERLADRLAGYCKIKTIKNYRCLFDIKKYGINTPLLVCLVICYMQFICRIANMALGSIVFDLEFRWEQTSFYIFAFIFSLVFSALFLICSHLISNNWILPLAIGSMASIVRILFFLLGTINNLGFSFSHIWGYYFWRNSLSTYFLPWLSIMLGMMIAMRFWGVRFSSIVIGGTLFSLLCAILTRFCMWQVIVFRQLWFDPIVVNGFISSVLIYIGLILFVPRKIKEYNNLNHNKGRKESQLK